ncbi:hypothetical protein MPSEU_000683000 [Mayamaea pseudoterrestris]|nr:hypothetical protein MPSEU_000683000 [Mayamaea pseudoterrestris]
MRRIASFACSPKQKLIRNVLLLLVLSIQSRVFLELVGLLRRQNIERITKAVPPLTSESSNLQYSPPINTYTSRPRPFPRWGEEGISIDNLLDYINASVVGRNFSVNVLDQRSREKDFHVFPETLYVLDSENVWVSAELRKHNRIGQANFAKYRAQPSERMMLLAREILQSEADATKRWPDLTTALQTGGIPFLAWYGDFKSCNRKNWNGKRSIPLFTTCAKVTCDYAWPMPTYRTIKDSQAEAASWEDIMNKSKTDYPWEQKKRTVVWRGGLTGLIKNYTSPRSRIARFGKAHRHESLFDIGLTGVPDKVMQYSNPNLRLLGGLHKPISPMEDFQKFIGIIDIDGNSWSSRFGKLLCFNSVILKVEPKYVDYFHFKDLVPWTHYIPVKDDLSDLVSMAYFVADEKNEDTVRKIIYNANQWCRERMTHASIARDLLDIWNEYTKSLMDGDANWMTRWNHTRQSIFVDAAYDMTRLADVVEDSASARVRPKEAKVAVKSR